MATQSTSANGPKRRRFIIFTDDEGIINQIQTSGNSANYQTTVIEYNETEHNIIPTAVIKSLSGVHSDLSLSVSYR